MEETESILSYQSDTATLKGNKRTIDITKKDLKERDLAMSSTRKASSLISEYHHLIDACKAS